MVLGWVGADRATVCAGCGCNGPVKPTSTAARIAAREAGWARSYPGGRGESFRCPKCRRVGGDTRPHPK